MVLLFYFYSTVDFIHPPPQIKEHLSTIFSKLFTFGFYLDKPECKKCAKVLMELENIDDEADQLGIGFVKINDESLAEEYNLDPLPALVYYRHQIYNL